MYAVYVKMSRDFHGGEFHGDFHGTRRTGPFRLRGVPEVRYLFPVPYVIRRGRETDGLDDSLHGPVPHAGAQGNGPPTFPVRGRAGDLLFRKHPRPLWTQTWGGTESEGGNDIVTDSPGNCPLQRHLS